MAIAASGAVSFSDLRTEYSASGAVSFSDFYRGASSNYVRANAANNTATNLSANVPTSGTINFTNFRSQARGFRFTFTTNATNQDASTLFGTDWGVSYPKDIVINSGVTVGATSTSNEALEISTGGLGTITITNNGTIIGAGGAAGGAGGDAFEAFVACTFVNNGNVYGGGGGGGTGGNGGTGGAGSYTTTTTQYHGPVNAWPNSRYYNQTCNANNAAEFWYYSLNYGASYCGNNCSWNVGGWTYSSGGSNGCGIKTLKRSQSSTSSSSGGAGGAGGAGGVGAGYNQSAAAGSSGAGGAAGGTNAGAGGSGGSGGTGGGYGASGSSGSNGNAGANGNAGSGAAGASGGSGGAGGASIRGSSYVTLTNNGTITGSQV
jgi:hypothetical protein